MSRLHWRKAKTLAMLANKRQWEREFDPTQTSEVEIELEQGNLFLVIETSIASSPNFIITE